MRLIIIAAVALLASGPAAGDDGSVTTAFIDMCKMEVKADLTDKLELRSYKIDPAGFCVCVAQSLNQVVSDDEVIALDGKGAGKPLPEAFLTKLKMAQALCRALMIVHAD